VHWLAALGSLPIAALTTDDIERWHRRFVEAGENSPGYRNLVLRALKALLAAAHRDGIHERNLGLRIKSESVSGQRRLNLTWDDVAEGLAGMTVHHRTYFVVLGTTGMRGGELRSASVDDLVDGWLHVSAERSKTGVPRDVPVPVELRSTLSEWLRSQRLRESSYREAWSSANLPESPHALRRMVVSELGSLGYRMALVSTIVGHSTKSMTEHYDGARGRQELMDMMEHYWAVRVRSVYSRLGGGHASE
jgi:integrase